MIPLIATMVGAYIIVQCVVITFRKPSEHWLVRTVSVLCALVSAFVIVALWMYSLDPEVQLLGDRANEIRMRQP